MPLLSPSTPPRILFVGLQESSHTHAWMSMLDGSEFAVRLFPVPSFVAQPPPAVLVGATGIEGLIARTRLARRRAKMAASKSTLATIIRQWRPDVIHTLGLDPAGEYYLGVREQYGLASIGKWVLQTRGGSDLALARFDPELAPAIARALCACDQLLSDNLLNYTIARQMGVKQEQLATIGTVPGTGGIDIDELQRTATGPPSTRSIILWPKAYESPWSKALPVIEALQQCWEDIKPCEVHMLAMTNEVKMWYWALPESIRAHCHAEARIPRQRVLALMTQARVMLAPSLVDGTPNSLFEAMGAGAVPIVSPIETICSIVNHDRNVLFARNLYPEEIATALRLAMKDDELVDRLAQQNLVTVRELADRKAVRLRVLNWYRSLLGYPIDESIPS